MSKQQQWELIVQMITNKRIEFTHVCGSRFRGTYRPGIGTTYLDFPDLERWWGGQWEPATTHAIHRQWITNIKIIDECRK